MASKEKLPSGRYRGIYRDSAGNKCHVPGTFETDKEALAAANEAEVIAKRQAAVKRGTLSAKIKWGDWWDTIAADRDFESDTGSTEDTIVEKHLRPYWGKTPLIGIDRNALQDFIDSYKKRRTPRGGRYAPATVRRIYAVLTVSINKAFSDGVITASPLPGVKLPKVPKKAKPYLSTDEADQYGSQLRDDYADIVDFGLETGFRPSEIAGLHDDQVDKRRKVLKARTVYVAKKKKMRDYPKDKDERDVPLTTRAWEIYIRAIAGRDMRVGCGVPHFDEAHVCKHALVFRTQRGAVLNVSALRKAMTAAAGRADLAPRSPYDMRRGFATRLREAGADPFAIMELMGHETLEQTHGYAQQGPEFNRRVRAALNDPAAAELRAVDGGQRGTEHGTEVPSQPRTDAHARRRRKTS